MLCWGIYRFIDSENPRRNFLRPRSKRYVICSPNADFKLIPTDLIYVFQQFDPRNQSPRKASLTKENEQKNVLRAANMKTRSSGMKRLIVTSNDLNETRTMLENDEKSTSLNKCFKPDHFYDC
jgi:hypothetical protein